MPAGPENIGDQENHKRQDRSSNSQLRRYLGGKKVSKEKLKDESCSCLHLLQSCYLLWTEVWERAKEQQPAECVWSASPSVLNLPYDWLVQRWQVQDGCVGPRESHCLC